ncbi:MAG: trehalose-6-phosphate synthase [Enhygromyxa sp.]
MVVSNRLPIVLERDEAGQLHAQEGSGGLVSAMQPILAESGGSWIGWLGSSDLGDARSLLGRAERQLGFRLHDVELSEEEVVNYYQGLANEVLWPLCHDQLDRCRFEPIYWRTYEQVNRKFAAAVAACTSAEDFVWIHDYHLTRVAAALREAGIERRLGFFLHIPFPAADLFAALPWRAQVIEGLLSHSLVGFQTVRDLDNFVACLARLGGGEVVEDGGALRRVRRPDGAVVTLAAAPISIDYQGMVERAAEIDVDETLADLRARMSAERLILGVDRLDYSKGIPQRLAAFDLALERYPELRGRVSLLQVVVPSRVEVEEYQALEREIDRLVGSINGKYWEPGWTPVLYAFRSLSKAELLAYYRASDVALVTPLKDGMNLICKEYCACSLRDDGVLVLSEFAGAAAQLGEHCLLVNPYDVEQSAAAIHEALSMDLEARSARMRALRRSIEREDIFWWVEGFTSLLPRSPPGARPRRRASAPVLQGGISIE